MLILSIFKMNPGKDSQKRVLKIIYTIHICKTIRTKKGAASSALKWLQEWKA